MEKFKRAFLALSMMSLLLSCKGSVKRLIYDYLDSDGPITLWGRKVEISYTDDLPTKVDSLYNEINNMVKEEKSSSNSLFNKVNSLYSLSYDYNRASMEADLYAAMDLTSEHFELSDKIDSEYTDALYKMNEVEKTIVKSDKYRSAYLKLYKPSLKGEALEEFIEECKNPSNPETVESQKAMNTLRNKYQAGTITAYEFLDEFVPLANDFAEEKGYDNYLEYAYANSYGRSYTVSDITSFSECAVGYLVPFKDKKTTQYNENVSSFSEEKKTAFEKMRTGFFGNSLKVFEKYAAKLGGSFLDNYDYMMDNGNYFLSAEPNSPYTAYNYGSSTFDTYLFFSRNYQTLDTFVHEFGHYNASYESGASNYDILETQSQGDEMLFSYYIANLSDIDEDIAHAYVSWEELNLINTSIRSTWVNEFETYIYTHEGMTEQEMLNKENELAVKYGIGQYSSFNDSYAGIVSAGSPGYYISYAVSAMSSLSLYALAVDKGFNAAASSYNVISSLSSGKSFEDMIEDASLYNPLTDEGYQSIVSALDK